MSLDLGMRLSLSPGCLPDAQRYQPPWVCWLAGWLMLLARRHLAEEHGRILANANTCTLQRFAQGGVRQESEALPDSGRLQLPYRPPHFSGGN